MSNPIDRAIERAGTAEELARRLGITPQAISQWKKVPPLRVLDVERATGIPRHELRPDIYPPPTTSPDASGSLAAASA